MVWKSAGSLALLLLTAAAAPPGPCGPGTSIEPGDQAAGTLANAGLGVPSFSAAESTCESTRVLPLNDVTARPDTTAGDVVHGLPSPQALRPVNEPRRSPEYR